MLFQRVVDEALSNHRELLSQRYADLRALGQAKVEVLEKAAELASKRHPISPELYKVKLVPTKDPWLDTRAYYNAVERFNRMYQPIESYKAEVEAQESLLREAGHHLKALEAERLRGALQIAEAWAIHPRDGDAEQQVEALESFTACLKTEEKAAEQARSYTWRAGELRKALQSLRFSD